MDVSKLEKLKVADLRSELQALGLDTKGVKAVLIERLKSAMDAGESTLVSSREPRSITPVTDLSTPNRRSRRTRSMTHSPTSSPVKKIEPSLEPLAEEVPIPGSEINEAILANQNPDDKHENEVVEVSSMEVKDSCVDVDTEKEEENIDHPATNGASAEDPSEIMETEETTDDENPGDIEKEDILKDDLDSTKEQKQSDENLNSSTMSSEKTSPSSAKRQARKRSRSQSETRRSHSRSKGSESRSVSPKYRRSGGRLSPAKPAEEATNAEDEPTIEDKQFGLSWFDSDLHLTIDPVSFTSAKLMNQDIFALVWSGARANYGVREGKVCFEVRLAEEAHYSRSHPFRDEPHLRGFRCGFSVSKTGLLLGEEENSFAYCETGRKAVNNEYLEYGKSFKLDDVIGCYLDLDSTPCTIKFTWNGEDLGTAFEFEKSALGETDALFPHITTKGYEFHVNFADNENLLGNAERPKRMKKKVHSESVNEKERKILTDSNEENWEVVDEAKDDEEEKIEKKNEEKEISPKEIETGDDVLMKESDENMEATEIKKDVAERDSGVTVKEEQSITSEQKSEPIDAIDESKKAKESNGESETENAEKPSEKGASNSEDNCSETSRTSSGPARKKRKQDLQVEDEMEEIEPEPRDPVDLIEGYELIALIPEEQYIPGPQRPESRKDCEVYLLVGLPGAGKTYWTLNHIKENPEKRYDVIGADALISKMTIDGKPRKSVHKGKWDRLYELCLSSLSPLEEIASKRRRNFILDQTNAYASAQRRKMKGFGDFKRIAVVCIPSEDELKRRIALKSEQGNANSIRESTLNNIKASFTLPSLEFGWFDEIIYTDLKGDEAKDEVKKYIEKGKKAVESSQSRDNRSRRDYNRRDDRRRYRRDDNFRGSRWKGGHNDGYGGSGNRWGGGGVGSRGGSTPWRDDRGYGGGGGGCRGYDNRNNRYSGGGGGNGGPQNWMQSNRNRYDDRFSRSGGSGRRYDSYGSGGSRDYRDRDRGHGGGGAGAGAGNSRRDSNYRSGNQRDFRPGHRDNRIENSRGGYERSSSKYSSNDTFNQYGSGKPATGSGGVPAKQGSGGKWSTYSQQQPTGWGGGGQQNQQLQQQQYPAQAQQQQQYWGYDQIQGYGNQQQQWLMPNPADPRQQQQWMAWWQQQQGNNQQQPQNQQQTAGRSGAGGSSSSGSGSQNQYWSQYSYPTQQSAAGAEANPSKK